MKQKETKTVKTELDELIEQFTRLKTITNALLQEAIKGKNSETVEYWRLLLQGLTTNANALQNLKGAAKGSSANWAKTCNDILKNKNLELPERIVQIAHVLKPIIDRELNRLHTDLIARSGSPLHTTTISSLGGHLPLNTLPNFRKK